MTTNKSPPLHDDATVLNHLVRTWLFVSGQTRSFVRVATEPAPQYQDYAYRLSLDMEHAGRHVTVGILLQRSDALAVASHMFGLEHAGITDDDIADACGEFCNVVSDRHLLQIGPDEAIQMGIPTTLPRHFYQSGLTGCRLEAHYQSTFEGMTLYVLVYESSAGQVL